MRRATATQRPDLSRMAEMHEHAAEAAQLMKALGNEQRLLVLCNLLEGPLSVGELNSRVELSQSALSQHLARMRDLRLVETRRAGQTIFYRLASAEVAAILETLYRLYCAPTGSIAEAA